MSAVENPSAFPCPADDKSGWHAEYGMTLRDYFAGQALVGASTGLYSGSELTVSTATMLAKEAYMLADAILAARQEKADDGLDTEAAAPGTGEALLTIARNFIDKHHVSCAEATGNDGVYEEAPLLVEQLAEVVGYYTYPDEDA